MKTGKFRKIKFYAIFFLIIATQTGYAQQFEPADPKTPFSYWKEGNEELLYYSINRTQFGEKKKGVCELHYKTADFLTGINADSIKILYLNKNCQLEKTVLASSWMSDYYTPLDKFKFPYTLKTTFSSEDSEGHFHSQMIHKNGKMIYKLWMDSAKDNPQVVELTPTYLEEDIWTRIRLDPQGLPLGKINMIPAQQYMRLSKQATQAYEAIAQLNLQIEAGGKESYIYTIQYPNLNRKLILRSNGKFPYQIIEWEEHININSKDSILIKAELQK